MPTYFDSDNQIFVHAGVDEEAGEYWMWGTSDDLLLGKFPASKGKFYKTIVAGHVGTGTRDLANDRSYHDVYYDGESHYYIDGSVYKGGKLLLLGYDENDGKYYQIESNRKIPVRKYEEYVSLDEASTQNSMEDVRMSFLIAGDTHGTLDLAKVVQYYDGRDLCYIVHLVQIMLIDCR